jgi:hypothetical protein
MRADALALEHDRPEVFDAGHPCIETLAHPDSASRIICGNHDASNPVESTGIVGKNFPFELPIEAIHRLERTYRIYAQPALDAGSAGPE